MIYGSLGQQHLPPEQQLSADFASVAVCCTCPTRQLDTVGVTARQGDFAINENQRQRFLARAFQKALHNSVFSEGHRLLGQIETLNFRPVQFGPGCVSREADQGLIDIDAANTCAAAERRVKYLDSFHFEAPSNNSLQTLVPIRSSSAFKRAGSFFSSARGSARKAWIRGR